MTVYYSAFRRLALIIAGIYGLTALFFLIVSEDLSDYQLLATYGKVLVYLLTPLFLLLSCRVEAVIGPNIAIRLGSIKRILAIRLALHGVCAIFCSVLWLVMTNLCAVLRYQVPLLRPGNISNLEILCYIPLWLLLAEVSVLIGKILPAKAAVLSYVAGYMIFTVELMSLVRMLPRNIRFLFAWFYSGITGAVALCVWCVILAAVLVKVCGWEDMLT